MASQLDQVHVLLQ